MKVSSECSKRLIAAAAVCLVASSTLVLVAAPSAQAVIHPNERCATTEVFSIYRNDANTMNVFDRAGVANDTNKTGKATFKADEGGTTSVSAGISLSAEGSAWIFAKVSATINASVTKTMTANIGFTAESGVKPHSLLKGDYGIYIERVTIKKVTQLTNCRQLTTKFAYSLPYRKIWRLYY